MKNTPTIFKIICLFVLGFMLTADVLAQGGNNGVEVYEIITKDGNKYYGTISSENEEILMLETSSLGMLSIKKESIKSRIKVNEKKYLEGEYWAGNIQSSRYFWGPNAFSLKRGEGYYQNIWVLFNQASIGITDNFTLGVGLVPTFLVGIDVTPIWLTPKISFPIKKDKISLGVGGLVLGVFGSDTDDVFASITYGVATFGQQDANFTLGLGYGYAEGNWLDLPAITASAMLRISRRSYMMTENYFIANNDDGAIISILGGRTIWEALSLDYGLLVPISEIIDGEPGSIGIPWLSLVIPFGNKR